MPEMMAHTASFRDAACGFDTSPLGMIAGAGDIPPPHRAFKPDATIAPCPPSRFRRKLPPIWHRIAPFCASTVPGQLSKIIRTLQHCNVRQVVMVGKVEKRFFFQTPRLDLRALRRLGQLPDYRDVTLMDAVADEFAREGLQVVEQTRLLGHLLTPEGVFGRHRPDSRAWRILATALRRPSNSPRMDIGQTVPYDSRGGGAGGHGCHHQARLCVWTRRRGGEGQQTAAGHALRRARCRAAHPGGGGRRPGRRVGSGGGNDRYAAPPGIDCDGQRQSLGVGRAHAGAAAIRRRESVMDSHAQDAPLLIIAGETSGDQHGAAMVRVLREDFPDLSIFGVGGEDMRVAGVETLFDVETLNVVGLVEVLAKVPSGLLMARRLLQAARKRGARVVVLIDAPGFNLPFASWAKQAGLQVVYYVSPQIWAWRQNRVHKVARRVDKMLTLFPFEVPFYAAAGVDAEYVGHPLLDCLPGLPDRIQAAQTLGLDTQRPLVALLPGSRSREVKLLLQPMLAALSLIRHDLPRCRVFCQWRRPWRRRCSRSYPGFPARLRWSASRA